MPLTYSGKSAVDPYSFYTNYEAFDGETRVIVAISREVIDDYGLNAALEKGSKKYDKGEREVNSQIIVRSDDFK